MLTLRGLAAIGRLTKARKKGIKFAEHHYSDERGHPLGIVVSGVEATLAVATRIDLRAPRQRLDRRRHIERSDLTPADRGSGIVSCAPGGPGQVLCRVP